MTTAGGEAGGHHHLPPRGEHELQDDAGEGRRVEGTAVTGAEMIAAERARQVRDEGYDSKHDDRLMDRSLAQAAACYVQEAMVGSSGGEVPIDWPWDFDMWKPSERIDDLVKAGALVAAEIDRLLRAGYTHGRPS